MLNPLSILFMLTGLVTCAIAVGSIFSSGALGFLIVGVGLIIMGVIEVFTNPFKPGK